MRASVGGWEFEWEGGAYIDVYPPGSSVPADCINCYDYEAGRVALPYTFGNLEGAAIEWMHNNWEDLASFAESVRGMS